MALTIQRPFSQNQTRDQNRNSGAISLLIGKLKVELLEKLERGFHGEVTLTVQIVGNDITEYRVGSAARSVVK